MKIIPIAFTIKISDLESLTATEVEASIKQHIIDQITEAINPMLNDEDFIDMSPTEDGSAFNISISLMIGSALKYIDATSKTVENLIELCEEKELDEDNASYIIAEATQPLVDLIS